MEQDIERQLELVRRGLIDRYADRLGESAVADALERAVQPFRDARVHDYVAVLSERAARHELDRLCRAGALTPTAA